MTSTELNDGPAKAMAHKNPHVNDLVPLIDRAVKALAGARGGRRALRSDHDAHAPCRGRAVHRGDQGERPLDGDPYGASAMHNACLQAVESLLPAPEVK